VRVAPELLTIVHVNVPPFAHAVSDWDTPGGVGVVTENVVASLFTMTIEAVFVGCAESVAVMVSVVGVTVAAV
jgi:hypothetical protein